MNVDSEETLVAERIHGRAALRDSVLPHRNPYCYQLSHNPYQQQQNYSLSPFSSHLVNSARLDSRVCRSAFTYHLRFAFNVLKFSALLDSSRLDTTRPVVPYGAYLSSQSRAPRDGGGRGGEMRGKHDEYSNNNSSSSSSSSSKAREREQTERACRFLSSRLLLLALIAIIKRKRTVSEEGERER